MKDYYTISSIAAFHEVMGLPKPGHPLISVVDFSSIRRAPAGRPDSVIFQFYSIWLKKDYKGKMKYGQREYDFDAGLMSFFSPGQVITNTDEEELTHSGWWLIIHPDFLLRSPLAKAISRSTWVNSGCRSARKSSSRKHFAICMYLGMPLAIRICLYCCGLCGRA